jgi:histone-lysine N-methyltransferase SETMAR
MTKFAMETTDIPTKSQIMTLLICFFNIKGIVHLEFITQGETVNQGYYVEILKWLHEAVHREGSELWSNNWILHHDNAPAHKVLSFKQFLAQKSITEVEHLPHSPDLTPNDFWLFPEKSPLNRQKISGY